MVLIRGLRWMRTGSATFAVALLAVTLVAPRSADAQVQDRAATGWFGFTMSVADQEQHETGELPVRPRGHDVEIEIGRVVNGSPADRAGLRAGDRLLRVNGSPIRISRFAAMLSRVQPGDTVRVRIRRDGRERELVMVAGSRRSATVFPELRSRAHAVRADSLARIMAQYMEATRTREEDMPRMAGELERAMERVERSGQGVGRIAVRVDSAAAALARSRAELFEELQDSALHAFRADGYEWIAPKAPFSGRISTGVPAEFRPPQSPPAPAAVPLWIAAGERAIAGAEVAEMNQGLGRYFGIDRGILILEVAEDTPAADAGLEPGDVIISAGGSSIGSIREIRGLLSRRGTEGAPLEVVRDGKRRSLRLAAR